MPSLEDVGKFINNVGLPGAIVIGGMIIAWRVCVFLAPIVKDMANRHNTFVDKTAETQSQQAETQSQQAETQRLMLDQITEAKEQLSTIGNTLVDHREILVSHGQKLDQLIASKKPTH